MSDINCPLHNRWYKSSKREEAHFVFVIAHIPKLRYFNTFLRYCCTVLYCTVLYCIDSGFFIGGLTMSNGVRDYFTTRRASRGLLILNKYDRVASDYRYSFDPESSGAVVVTYRIK
jgi:hypothetical protein